MPSIRSKPIKTSSSFKKAVVVVVLACLAAGLSVVPVAAKKNDRGVVKTTLYLHGTRPVGEAEAFLPVVHENLLMMDSIAPTSQERSKQITNYGAGPNTQCAGNNLFPSWIGEATGRITGDVRFDFTSIGTSGLVDIKVWADVPGGTDFCDEGYIEPHAQALGVEIPVGEVDIVAKLKGPQFAVKRTLLVQISPSTMDVAGTQRPGSNLFSSRIWYDSEGHPSGLSFSCRPPAGRSSCTP